MQLTGFTAYRGGPIAVGFTYFEVRLDMLTREWDLIELPDGKILTTVGTFEGPRARGRLTYVPDDDGGLAIFGRRYRKISYEVWGAISHARQVLVLPGESHYDVHKRDIARHHPAIALTASRPELVTLVAALNAANIPVAVGGSRALNAARAESDYDLVIYGSTNMDRAAKVITALDGYRRQLHGALDATAKYRHFTRLTSSDLELLIVDRWRHFRVHGVAVSVDGADTDVACDRWAFAGMKVFDSAHVRGVVLDGSQCYLSPKIIDVQTDAGVVRVFTWLNLYAGALRTGDQVAVYGSWVVLHGQQFLLVQESTHAIRVVARTSNVLV